MNHFPDDAFFTLTLFCFASIGLWLSSLANRFSLPSSERRRTTVGTLGFLLLWLLLTAFLSLTGGLTNPEATMPPLILVPVTGIILVVLVHLTLVSTRMLQFTPRHWPVAIQTFRVGVELSILGLYLSGRAPIQVTFEGRNFDILVGLTAPLLAFAMIKLKLNPRVVVLWNVMGLLILGNTIFTVLTSTPGPIHRDWPGEPFTELPAWPIVWLPAFLAPFAVFAHIFSIRQNILLSTKKGNSL